MKIVICGDFVPTKATVSAFESNNPSLLLGDALGVIQTADFAIANLECALTDTSNPIRKCGPNLKGKYEYSKVYSNCGFTHLCLSNNHVMDFGITGFEDTIQSVRSAGMIPFGYGTDNQDSRKPLIIDKDGMKVAVIAVCEHEYSYALNDQMGANPFDPFDTMEDIQLAKQAANRVIVIYHGGKEQCEYPSKRLRKACRAMVRAGADLVLTQHSHCIGCSEFYQGGVILYGQGNFNFVDCQDNPQWHYGLMAIAEINSEMKVQLIPVVTNASGISLAKGNEKEQILQEFHERNIVLQDERKWIAEWEAFCNSPQLDYYLTAPIEAFANIPKGERCAQVFSAFLNCEAHLDVWQTLFKTWHAEKKSKA